MSYVRLRNGQELVCLWSMTGSMGSRGSRSSTGGGGGSSSSMRLQMFGTNLLQRAEWQGYTAFLLRELAEQDLLCQDSRCSLLHACPSRRVAALAMSRKAGRLFLVLCSFVLCGIRTWDTARGVWQRQRTLRVAFVVRGNPLEERNFLIGKEEYDQIEGTCVCIFTRPESPPVGGTFGRPCAGSGDADYRIRPGSSSLPTDASC